MSDVTDTTDGDATPEAAPCAWHRGGCPEPAWAEGQWPVLCRHHNVVVGVVFQRTRLRVKCTYGCGKDATTIDEAGDYVCRTGGSCSGPGE